ncbi:hypothetical protein FDP41_002793 [Naegleria fowleri]|uniref:Uncharacterized protein n=1 Tax=Naegleria fowleri TaxID=5763 RepID=A0A6A5BWS5_NAEFO|nr:uncharacterized protein FDP41_002793 [Naegleria fowleri]KAF0978278.1 hypothetical protein FDP41_002793 [Naegleria fowleri]CAG4716045.1 unnamed protein product [Naegleria fowleri]
MEFASPCSSVTGGGRSSSYGGGSIIQNNTQMKLGPNSNTKTTSSLLHKISSGMNNRSPLNNGRVLHSVYGTPYSSCGGIDDDELCSPQIPMSSEKKKASVFSPKMTTYSLDKENKPPSKIDSTLSNEKGKLDYEIAWRDEKIRLLEQERINLNSKMEDYAKQNLNLREELRKAQSNTSNPANELMQMRHERDSIQEYAEQIRQQKQNLQEQLNLIKQGNSNIEKEFERRGQVIQIQENQIKELSTQLEYYRTLSEQLQLDKEKMQQDMIEAQTNLQTKIAEYDELNGVQEELLRAITEEKKKATDLIKAQASDKTQIEKLKKENERLELLVDKLQSDMKRDHQEIYNQKILFNSTIEETQRKLQDDITKLTKLYDEARREIEEKDNMLSAQQQASQQKILSLTDQLREQMDKYERNLTLLKQEESNEKKRHAAQISKLKKELNSSMEMIKMLKEANKNLEDNFNQHQKIITALEERLEKEKQEKEELSENLDILKNKLPKMLHLLEE